LGGFLHVGTDTASEADHWVVFMVDFSIYNLFYGDSLSKPPPARTLAALKWWLSQHSSVPFEVAAMLCTQADGNSWGILASNTLAHHLFPSEILLMNAKAVEYGQMAAAVEVIK
jgi:hypothetical protein